ncbi:MAG TPA: class I SAM-dependent methyltransferase [Candidatus Ornithomonoglobus intestinigallinarum]|uniref:Class I SAM-dependent methyltransferase n=1 Tax=Candidatus Ornithomonoglobus intestinigallinarum TaxID=2840894 RepID=A0A9D1H615_9FIRM|nr:class I SAM-dependent methyltransferase [Candidatus Ornithomonoglobus intestinigallinarum]
MFLADKWTDFTLADAADGEKLEYWGKYLLRRPDPQAVWSDKSAAPLWDRADAVYSRSRSGGGKWSFKKRLPDAWQIRYRNLTFNIKPMGFKHTGLFPEQAVNWDWFSELISNAGRKINVLNLFAYTGGATAAALGAGASVCHVDASKGMVTWAKENVVSSGLGERPVRYIVDDVLKFVRREGRRGRKYDAVIMDPPSYGRGPSGEVWKIEDELYPLIKECMEILSDKPLFFLINSYTTGLSAQILKNILALTVEKKYGGRVTADEIGLPIKNTKLILPCGISGRWEA